MTKCAKSLIVAAAGLCLPTALSAQECGDCYYGQGEHWAVGSYAPFTDYTEGSHGWHFWTKSFNCVSHGICAWGDEEQDPEELIDRLAEAVGSRDWDGLRRLAESPVVRLNRNRGAIQVVGCDGEEIIAHVPVEADLLRAIDEAGIGQ